VLGLEHHDAAEHDGCEWKEHREQTKPCELEPKRRQAAQCDASHEPRRERSSRDEECELDHATNL
jgi:hypothetical protein